MVNRFGLLAFYLAGAAVCAAGPHEEARALADRLSNPAVGTTAAAARQLVTLTRSDPARFAADVEPGIDRCLGAGVLEDDLEDYYINHADQILAGMYFMHHCRVRTRAAEFFAVKATMRAESSETVSAGLSLCSELDLTVDEKRILAGYAADLMKSANEVTGALTFLQAMGPEAAIYSEEVETLKASKDPLLHAQLEATLARMRGQPVPAGPPPPIARRFYGLARLLGPQLEPAEP